MESKLLVAVNYLCVLLCGCCLDCSEDATSNGKAQLGDVEKIRFRGDSVEYGGDCFVLLKLDVSTFKFQRYSSADGF